MIENLLMYTCAKHCRKRWSSDKAIAKIKRCSFLPHSVYTDNFVKKMLRYFVGIAFFLLRW